MAQWSTIIDHRMAQLNIIGRIIYVCCAFFLFFFAEFCRMQEILAKYHHSKVAQHWKYFEWIVQI